MGTEQQVASERTVIKASGFGDENTGVIVAAGDVIPAGVGIISNTPNKVDAAANYDEVDAADKAGAGARPATRVVESGTGPDAEIVERVEANRNAWEQESRMLGEQAAAPGERDAVQTVPQDGKPEPEQETTTSKAPADMTVAELDSAYGTVDGYPSKGNKAEKVAFAQKQGA